jgi:hypothetical protein
MKVCGGSGLTILSQGAPITSSITIPVHRNTLPPLPTVLTEMSRTAATAAWSIQWLLQKARSRPLPPVPSCLENSPQETELLPKAAANRAQTHWGASVITASPILSVSSDGGEPFS